MTQPVQLLSPFPDDSFPDEPAQDLLRDAGVGHGMRSAAANLLETAASLTESARSFRDSARSLECAAEMNKTAFAGRHLRPALSPIANI